MKKIVRHFFVALLFLQVAPSAKAQPQFSGWLASFNTFKVNRRFSLHLDVQLRSTDELRQVQTILLRPGLNFHAGKSFILTAGYAFINNRRAVNGISGLLPEHRIWQQGLFNHKVKNTAIAHRIRFEERFISKAKLANNEVETEGHNQAFRIRYFIRSVIPLTTRPSFPGGFFLALQNEVFLNTGNKSAVNGKGFDQNRLYGAVGYRLPNKVDLEAGYMNQYISARTSFTNNHIAQIAVYKRL
ncbi:MAG TPA: DUF2490 domain-containing protein [Flavisolibacter sp.]|jgi:hypothetical protein|nr:DUF2490 domain-containing protein [Flavisolibacter sp.]